MRFNETQTGSPQGKPKKESNSNVPKPGSYTSKDLEKAKDRPFLGGR